MSIGSSSTSLGLCLTSHERQHYYFLRPNTILHHLSYIALYPYAVVKKGKRGACKQKAATVLPNRTAAT